MGTSKATKSCTPRLRKSLTEACRLGIQTTKYPSQTNDHNRSELNKGAHTQTAPKGQVSVGLLAQDSQQTTHNSFQTEAASRKLTTRKDSINSPSSSFSPLNLLEYLNGTSACNREREKEKKGKRGRERERRGRKEGGKGGADPGRKSRKTERKTKPDLPVVEGDGGPAHTGESEEKKKRNPRRRKEREREKGRTRKRRKSLL